MKVLIGYETSGITRRAFQRLGHDAWSCDVQPSQDNTTKHIQDNVHKVMRYGWDLAIFHPDCTYLSNAAAWAYHDGPYHQKIKPGTLVGEARREARVRAAADFLKLTLAPIPRIVIENPIGVMSTLYRVPDQIIQPFQFGHDASKATCLWLLGVPPLPIDPKLYMPGRMVEWPRGSGRLVERWANQTDAGQNNISRGPDRWRQRSMTYPLIARAFAQTWGWDYIV